MNIAVLISGQGTNLQALIDYLPDAKYQIAVVISNRTDAKGLDKAQDADIATEVVDDQAFDDRQAFDQALLDTLTSHEVEAVVMAGFMRIVSEVLVHAYSGKMLNIHPSLLPKYPGLNTHERALEAGDSEHGLSVHFVTEQLDGGPVILQATTPINDDDTPQALKQRVQSLEHEAYPLVVNLMARGDVHFKNDQAWFRDNPLETPIMLNKLQTLLAEHKHTEHS